jgi:hemerythrin superfamily protein
MAISPSTDGIDLLVAQHRALEDLLDRTLEATDPAQRRGLFRRVGDELSVHLGAEEQVFYPAVRARRTEDILLESLEEHLSLKRLLADLLEIDPQERTFEPKFKVLREQTAHHHEEEEEHLFPKVRQLLSSEEIARIGAEMAALQTARRRDEDAPRESVVGETGQAAELPPEVRSPALSPITSDDPCRPLPD